MAEHTPTPWSIGYGGQDGDNYAVINSPLAQYPICSLESFGYSAENAAFIVEAVNSYDKLIADRKALLLVCRDILDFLKSHGYDTTLVKAAIAQAEKEG